MSQNELGLGKIGQIFLRATNLSRAVAFYRETLGLPFLFEVPRMAFFDLAGVRLMLGEPEQNGPDDPPPAPASILYFEVSDLERIHQQLEERGVLFDAAPSLIADMPDHELWMAFFKDTEGNQLALMSEVPKA